LQLRKVLELLEERVLHTNDKAVIVSQWTSYLNILAKFLDEKSVSYCMLSGNVPAHKRNEIVVDFNRANGGAKLMLLSLAAGGVGLNLIGGNHLFLLDLHWNPQLEAHAQDQIHRVGQTKPVFIYK
jgi:transcription termination factor 2